MQSIRIHSNLKKELQIVQIKLDMLLNKKIELHTKYVGVKSAPLGEKVQCSNDVDKFALYMHELTKINEITGLSLDKEIEITTNEVNNLRYYINLIEYQLKELKGYEYDLYYKIAVLGLSITKAVENVAEKNNVSDMTIWTYYNRIKKEVKKLKIRNN